MFANHYALTDKFVENLALSTPLVPCERITLPQTTRNFDPDTAVLALYM